MWWYSNDKLISGIFHPFFRWRRANNATGTSSNHSGGNQSSTNGDNVSSSDDEEDDEIAQRPLQMYLHHQQYYKQMKEIQKQQKEAATTVRPENARTNSGSDKNDEDDVDVNWRKFVFFVLLSLGNILRLPKVNNFFSVYIRIIIIKNSKLF